MPESPTNTDLLEAISSNIEIFKHHAILDEAFQDKQKKFNLSQAVFKTQTEGKLIAMVMKLEDVATKDDIAELKKFMKEIKIGLGIIRVSWNNIGKIGALFTTFGIFYLFLKFGFLGLVTILFPGSK